MDNIGIDTDLMTVTVKPNQQSSRSVKYSLQDSLFDIDGDSKVYFIQEVDDERYQVIFGDNIFGKKLEDSNFIEVNYITSSGCLLYTSPSPRDRTRSRMPSSA